jgi:Fe-S cluster biogenesis protein NfuA
LLGSCDGCPSSSVTLQHAVKQAIEEAAPEIVHIDVVDDSPAVATPPASITLSKKPVPTG